MRKVVYNVTNIQLTVECPIIFLIFSTFLFSFNLFVLYLGIINLENTINSNLLQSPH